MILPARVVAKRAVRLVITVLLITLCVMLPKFLGGGVLMEKVETWVENWLNLPTLETIVGGTSISAPTYLGGKTQVCFESEYQVQTNQAVAHPEALPEKAGMVDKAKVWLLWQAEGRQDKVGGVVRVEACSLLSGACFEASGNKLILFLPLPEYSTKLIEAKSELVKGGLVVSSLDFVKKEGAQQLVTEESRHELENEALRNARQDKTLQQGIIREANATLTPLLQGALSKTVSNWAQTTCLEAHSKNWCQKAQASLAKEAVFEARFIP